MKATIITNIKLLKSDIGEIKDLIPGIELSIEETNLKLIPKENPYFKEVWGDFNWLRSIFLDKTNVRCFSTSDTELKNIHITSHIGMYDATDGDSVIDFYIGIPEKFDNRARNNGFKSNLAWLFIHEMLHGKELLAHYKDRTHSMEAQGRLKELLTEHLERDKLVEKVGLLQIIYELTLKLKNLLWYTKN